MTNNVLLLTADFGLAKQKQKDSSKMMSVVGTILYSWWESLDHYFPVLLTSCSVTNFQIWLWTLPLCSFSPELLQNQPYGEKADVWAIGCILYQMCALKPPFYSSNMLTLATKIVKAEYEPISADLYSSQVTETVHRYIQYGAEVYAVWGRDIYSTGQRYIQYGAEVYTVWGRGIYSMQSMRQVWPWVWNASDGWRLLLACGVNSFYAVTFQMHHSWPCWTPWHCWCGSSRCGPCLGPHGCTAQATCNTGEKTGQRTAKNTHVWHC